MDKNKLHALTLWLAREVARLHATTASLQKVIEELRILDPRLDVVKAHEIQREEWEKFFLALEKFDPAIAALVDQDSKRLLPDDE